MVASNGADIVGATTAAIAAFVGPLHGGAITGASEMLAELGNAVDASDFVVAVCRYTALVTVFIGHWTQEASHTGRH